MLYVVRGNQEVDTTVRRLARELHTQTDLNFPKEFAIGSYAGRRVPGSVARTFWQFWLSTSTFPDLEHTCEELFTDGKAAVNQDIAIGRWAIANSIPCRFSPHLVAHRTSDERVIRVIAGDVDKYLGKLIVGVGYDGQIEFSPCKVKDFREVLTEFDELEIRNR